METVFGINMVALGGRPAAAAVAQGNAGCVLAPSARVVTRRTVYELRKGARSAATFWKVSPSRSPTSTRSSRRSRPRRRPRKRKSRLMSRPWNRAPFPTWLVRAGAISTRPEAETAVLGIVEGGYLAHRDQAQAILEMRLNRLTGLEQDKDHRGGVPGAAGDDPRSRGHPGPPERLLDVIRKDSEYNPRNVRRQAGATEIPDQSRRSEHRRSHHARGRGVTLSAMADTPRPSRWSDYQAQRRRRRARARDQRQG